jgi:hypothetical protein
LSCSEYRFDLQESNCDVWASIDETDNPSILLAKRLTSRTFTLWATVWDTQGAAESQIGAVGARLIPTLNGGGNGVHDDGEIENTGLLEPVGSLLTQRNTLILVQLFQLLKEKWSLSEESTLAQKINFRFEAVLCGKRIDISEKLLPGNTDEGILNPSWN